MKLLSLSGAWLGLALSSGFLLTSGCSQTVAKPNALEGTCVVESVEAPDWVCGTYHEEGQYLATGSARMSQLGFDFSRKEALANARVELANKISTTVKSKVETYARSIGVKSDWPEKVVTQISRQVSEVGLKNVQQYSYWQNEKTKTIYVLLRISPENVEDLASQAVEMLQPSQVSNMTQAQDAM